MPGERNELRAQLTNLLHKVAYQLGLWTLAYMRSAERINAPTLRLAAGDQRADAHDLMQRMFWEALPERLPDVRFGSVAQIQRCRSASRIARGSDRRQSLSY